MSLPTNKQATSNRITIIKPFSNTAVLLTIATQNNMTMRRFVILISIFFLFNLSSCATHVATEPAQVTIVKKAPRNHKIVTVKGKRYYFWNGNYYKKTRRGFVLVNI